jgi:toluene monooxygenase system protein E
MSAGETGPKTYWHLAAAKRVPSDYEIATSRLLYYVERGFEVALPLDDWYRRYQRESPLASDDWERFCDPRETTYAKYTALQQAKEAHVDGIFRSIDEGGYDQRLDRRWVETLEKLVPPLRYLGHGLQMLAAYVGQMAPSGRITVAAAFQAADEMRRVQRLAYRMAELRQGRPGFGDDARRLWQEDPAWQPARKLCETMMVVRDWGESFAALDLCAKPVLDAFILTEVAKVAKDRGDYLLGEIFFSLREDAIWHQAWSRALVEVALAARPENRGVLAGWIRRWLPAADESVGALARLLGDAGPDAAARASAAARAWLQPLGVLP